MAAPEPFDEALRQLVLEECALLDTQPDPMFDAITELAATLCQTPIALVSLVDRKRQWFKSRHGLPTSETPRDQAFCAHAVAAAEPLEVEDATADARFCDNPLVTGEPGIRFYSGVPITVGDEKQPIGTVCVIDTRPRRLTEAQRQGLRRLADMAAALINERRNARLALERAEQAGDQLRRMALTDSVTGALNRRGFMDQARWSAASGGALLLAEIDDLPGLVERNGMGAGEAAARTVISLAGRAGGREAVVGRLTASASAIFLPRAGLDRGRATADHLRDLLAASPLDSATGRAPVTVTVGVAAVEGMDGIERALAAADTALTEARALGGNMVVVCARSRTAGAVRT